MVAAVTKPFTSKEPGLVAQAISQCRGEKLAAFYPLGLGSHIIHGWFSFFLRLRNYTRE